MKIDNNSFVSLIMKKVKENDKRNKKTKTYQPMRMKVEHIPEHISVVSQSEAWNFLILIETSNSFLCKIHFEKN